jgi:hypothetical protein
VQFDADSSKEAHLVTVRFSPSRASFRRAAILALAVTLVPLPLAAAEKAAPAQAPAQPLRTSIAKHAAREALVTSTRRTPQNAAPQNSARPRAQSNNPQSTGFFRSPAGIACLAVIAVGTGYALYSASNDRIHSVVRDGQK